MGVQCDEEERITAITLAQSFLEYDLWQNYETGREVPWDNRETSGRKKCPMSAAGSRRSSTLHS